MSTDSPKQQPLWERLRFLVKERRHVQLGVVTEDLLAAAEKLEKSVQSEIAPTKGGDAIGSENGQTERLARGNAVTGAAHPKNADQQFDKREGK